MASTVLMNLSNAFHCIPHNLEIAKLAAYGLDKNMICRIYSYLKSRKQCASVNNVKSTFEVKISRVPYGSIAGLMLFNIFLIDFFYFILVALAHNFADDNTLSSFAKTMENLISILESKSEIVINWKKEEDKKKKTDLLMQVDSKQSIFDKLKENHANQIMNTDQKGIKPVSKVKPMWIEIDVKLNFNYHMNNICKYASNQLKTLIRLKHILRFERKVLVNTFLMSILNCCFLKLDLLECSIIKQNDKAIERSFTLLVERLWQHLWRSARKIWLSKYEFSKYEHKKKEKAIYRNL